MSSLQIGKVIYQLLAKYNAYPLVADEGTTFPFIVYRRSGLTPASTKDRFNYQELANVEILVVSDKYDESITIAEDVKSILEHSRGIYSNIKVGDIQLVSSDESFMEDSFIQKLIFKIEII